MLVIFIRNIKRCSQGGKIIKAQWYIILSAQGNQGPVGMWINGPSVRYHSARSTTASIFEVNTLKFVL